MSSDEAGRHESADRHDLRITRWGGCAIEAFDQTADVGDRVEEPDRPRDSCHGPTGFPVRTNAGHAQPPRGRQIVEGIVADHRQLARRHSDVADRLTEKGGSRLANHGRPRTGRRRQRGDKGAAVERHSSAVRQAVLRCMATSFAPLKSNR